MLQLGTVAWDSDNDEEEEHHHHHHGATGRPSDAGNAQNGDNNANDENDDDDRDEDEDEEDEDRLPPNYVRVAWPDRVEEELSADRLRVIDRSFLHGDVVVRRSDPEGQIGTVVDVQVLADCHWEGVNGGPDALNLTRLDTKHLEPAHPFLVGRYVTKGAMLGIVHDTKVDVDVAFGGSSPHAPKGVCTLRKPAPSIYKPQLRNGESIHEDDVGHGIYYPGMRVRAKHQAWKKATWTHGKHDAATAAGDIGTVLRVRPVSIHVEWISGDQELMGDDGASEVVLTPEECSLLGLWEETRWQVGDHCVLANDVKQREVDRVVAEHLPAADATQEAESKESASETPSSNAASSSTVASVQQPVRSWDHSFAFCGTITRTYTRIRVEWQDGTTTGEELVSSLEFISRDHLLENDFLPNDYAVMTPSGRLVHVLAVDARERMVQVRYLERRFRQFEEGEWHLGSEEEEDLDQVRVGNSSLTFVPPPRAPESFDENDHKEAGTIEWTSVFELKTNPNFEFCLGGVVVRIPGTKDAQTEAALPPDSRLGHAGQVLAMKDGLITVMWSDRTTSVLEVDQLMIVEHDEGDDDDEEEEEDDEYYDEDGECPDCGEDCDGNCGCECHSNEAQEDNGVEQQEEEGDRSDSEVSNDAFPSEWSSANYWKRAPANAADNATTASPARTSEQPEVDAAASAMGHLSLASSAVAIASAATPQLPYIEPATARAGYEYSSFDVIEAPSDNDDDDENDDDAAPSAAASGVAAAPSAAAAAAPLLQHKYAQIPFGPVHPKSFVKRVREECRLLHASLPAGIHVLTYESRMDLFKVLIVGSAATPYFLNLFQFDLRLPADYPASPPEMFFFSRGNRLNPNLYIDGHICLSLLNTWKGSNHTQRWDPANSNLLQLFVSLQGLVIGVADPYYLEVRRTHT